MPVPHIGRRTLLLGAGVLALGTACSTGGPGKGSATSAETVTTAYGPVRGVRRDTGTAYLGIPYAQPPVGRLRFAAPVPPTPWRETLDCTRYGPTAQRKQLSEVTAIPEPSIPGDGVLNLNVFSPDTGENAKLPVLVWIHGGGFVAGSAASPWYDGAAFNRDGVIVVSIGYRLGIEGFLHLDGAPDNRGVLDWIAALEWVRDNIAAFGGDPDRVTVAGQSAGGGAVWALMAAPAAKGLFRAGISASGAVSQPNDRATAVALAELFTKRSGLPATAAALGDLSGDRIQDLEDTLRAIGPDSGSALALAPFADGDTIPLDTAELLKSGGATNVPLLLGFTRDEFNAMAQDQPVTDAALPAAFAAMGLPPDAVDAFRAAYPADNAAQLLGQAQSDLLLRAPSYKLAEDRAKRDQPTWFYEFTWASKAPKFQGTSFHCLDVPFAFDCLKAQGVTAVAGDNPPQSLADAVHRSWVSFVTHGDPGGDWPRYTAERRQTMIWSESPRVQADPFAAQRALWLR
ncbi:carboxylesterase/lipase family protein [Nocardia acidivorans]|uniref:carboxylesterase/lipase family protein n=1 Tax=Nocardia acidivorans TaxID=404580 RepID=UPI000A045AE0|nr:carboxylesterase family protein [Nocardia acidivorans]